MKLVILLVVVALWVAACQQPGTPLPSHTESPLPAPRITSPLPPPFAPRAFVVPRTFIPLVRATDAFHEDNCSSSGEAAAMLDLIREAAWQKRKEVNCHPLLALAAHWKAQDMATKVYASHVSPNGWWPNQYVRAFGYVLPSWYAIKANNVESFGAGYATKEAMIAAWKTSSTHWTHVAALHSFFVGQECAAVGYYHTPGKNWQHYWVFVSAPCPQ